MGSSKAERQHRIQRGQGEQIHNYWRQELINWGGFSNHHWRGRDWGNQREEVIFIPGLSATTSVVSKHLPAEKEEKETEAVMKGRRHSPAPGREVFLIRFV